MNSSSIKNITTLQQISAPVGRVLLATIFFMSGLTKITAYAGTQGYMEAMGVPGMLLPLVIALEVLGGLAIMLGWQTRLVAFALAGFSILSAMLFHADFSDQMQMAMFMKNVAIAGGFLMLVAQGPGAYALDNRASSK
ncbi:MULTISPECIES: DoxX family protein [Colwellia]|uniref:Membrane protein n=1 Tax=Colwellia marinimaniae TaxID=1513592 RepID=A0ABQ0MWG9_9GAMM|nr:MULTISPECIES: DoxX family protein [Colwellia]GAW96726.1 membrane protein [Colwellia marinimaniae]